MRTWILLPLVVACAEPPRRPPQQPADPSSVNGCRSSPTALGGMRYTCSTYEVYDSAMAGTSIRWVENHLVTAARAKGFETTTRVIDARTMATREETCKSTLDILLARPAPAGSNVSAECTRATNMLPKLPGRVEPADASEELRGVMVEFAARCTDKIAACALAAKTYVEATLCRD